MNYVLIANNTCDLPEDLLATLDLTLLPLGFNIGDDAYKTMPLADFYQKLRAGAMPTTNAANVGEYVDIFDPVLSAGHDVLCLVFSSGLSATYNSAVMAADEMREKYPDRTLVVIDTLAASAGEGLLVHGAAKMRLAGKSIDEVAAWVENTKGNVAHWLTIDDLNHLKRGGRISAATAVVGGILGVKPVLRVNETGHLVPADKARGRQAALQRLIAEVEKTPDLSSKTVYISHSECLDEAQLVATQLREKLGVGDVIIGQIGPVIGSHTGIGVVAVFWIANGR